MSACLLIVHCVRGLRRRCDAIVHVVRCFDDPNIVHVDGSIDPLRDIEVINLELMLADLFQVQPSLSRLFPHPRSHHPPLLSSRSVSQLTLTLMTRLYSDHAPSLSPPL